MSPPQAFGHEDFHRKTEEFLLRVSENPLDLSVGEEDGSSLIHEHRRIRSCVEKPSEPARLVLSLPRFAGGHRRFADRELFFSQSAFGSESRESGQGEAIFLPILEKTRDHDRPSELPLTRVDGDRQGRKPPPGGPLPVAAGGIDRLIPREGLRDGVRGEGPFQPVAPRRSEGILDQTRSRPGRPEDGPLAIDEVDDRLEIGQNIRDPLERRDRGGEERPTPMEQSLQMFERNLSRSRRVPSGVPRGPEDGRIQVDPSEGPAGGPGLKEGRMLARSAGVHSQLSFNPALEAEGPSWGFRILDHRQTPPSRRSGSTPGPPCRSEDRGALFRPRVPASNRDRPNL